MTARDFELGVFAADRLLLLQRVILLGMLLDGSVGPQSASHEDECIFCKISMSRLGCSQA